jgi:hypothetical protein
VHRTGPGVRVGLQPEFHGGLLGALGRGGFDFILDALRRDRLIETIDGADGASAMLSFDGWRRFEELRRGQSRGKSAFMAMSFHNVILDKIFRDNFKPAAHRAGFKLMRLDEEPRAGLIDDRLRVEIRRSRFLVADLSGENPGPYWEAGYAEGLGKPVIYSCDSRGWENQGTHFDTSLDCYLEPRLARGGGHAASRYHTCDSS